MDIARSLSRRYMEEMPVSRRRINARLDTKMRRKVRCSVSYRSVDDSGGSESRWNGRLRLDKPAGRKKSTGWRIGFAWAESGEDRGPFVEAGGILRREHLRLDMTIAGFAIPSYRSRLYIYERNVAGRGGTGAVWGNGWTAVLVSRYKAISARCIFKDSDLMSSTTEYTVQFDVDF